MNEEIKADLMKMTQSYEAAAKTLEDLDEKQIVETLKSFEKLRSLNQQMSQKIQKYLASQNSVEDSETPFVFNIALLSEELNKMNEAASRLATKLRMRFEEAELELKQFSVLHLSQMEQIETIQKLMQDDLSRRN